MKHAQAPFFELSSNQKQFWFLNKENFEQLYTQISIKFLTQVSVEELALVISNVVETHETLSSSVVSDESSVFPLQSPFHFKKPSIEILPIAAYEAWISNQNIEINNGDLEAVFPIRFFYIFRSPE